MLIARRFCTQSAAAGLAAAHCGNFRLQLTTSPASQWKSEVKNWKLGVAIALLPGTPLRLELLNRPFEPLNQPTNKEPSDFGNGSERWFITLNELNQAETIEADGDSEPQFTFLN